MTYMKSKRKRRNANKTIDIVAMQNADVLFNVLNNINNWTMNCDTKASVILGSYGVAFSLLLVTDVLTKIIDTIKSCFDSFNVMKLFYFTLFVISCICLITGFTFLVSVLVPRIDKNEESLMFFASVNENKDVNIYKEKANKYSEKNTINDLQNQIYAASKICTTKFTLQKKGLIFSVIGLVLIFVWIIIAYCVF